MDDSNILQKALHRAILNNYKCGGICKSAVNSMHPADKEKVVNSLFADLADPDNEADGAEPPATSEAVLHKDGAGSTQKTVSEMHSIKQANANATSGIRPTTVPKPAGMKPKMPAGMAAPKTPKKSGGASGAPMMAMSDELAKEENGLNKLKVFMSSKCGPQGGEVLAKEGVASKLKGFLAKKSGGMEKADHSKEERKAMASKAHMDKFKKFTSNSGSTDPARHHAYGINKPMHPSEPGTSVMGHHIKNKTSPVIPVKEQAKIHLKHLKAAPKPDLGKTAADEKGVHQDLAQWGTGKKGVSGAGRNVRTGKPAQIAEARDFHRRTLSEIKKLPKPDLGKSEDKKEESKPKEPHQDHSRCSCKSRGKTTFSNGGASGNPFAYSSGGGDPGPHHDKECSFHTPF